MFTRQYQNQWGVFCGSTGKLITTKATEEAANAYIDNAYAAPSRDLYPVSVDERKSFRSSSRANLLGTRS